ncbi:hypothetical protein [Nostoc sp.]|uniref:hypothetical protein n=1 Tax=Nostoc sp. TaxID=1180 RepID=UPI002FF7C5BD
MNLAVSLITIAASLTIRGSTLSFSQVIPLLSVVFSLITGAVIIAFLGAAIAGRLSQTNSLSASS